MAELTNLEEKLAEVTGLAMAAQAAGSKVEKLTEEADSDLVGRAAEDGEGGSRDRGALHELAGTSTARRRRSSTRRAR